MALLTEMDEELLAGAPSWAGLGVSLGTCHICSVDEDGCSAALQDKTQEVFFNSSSFHSNNLLEM